MNKKGDFQSIVIMIAIVFALAIAAIIFSKVFLDITGELKQTEEFSNNTIETLEIVEQQTIPLMDFLIFFSLVGLIIGIIISSIYINTHPAIMVVFIVAFLIAIFLGGMLANVYDDFKQESEISSTAAQFKFSNLILGKHFPIIILVVGIIVIVVLYGKSKSGMPGV